MTFRIGVIGATGYIGAPYRAEIREADGHAKIVALCARRPEPLAQAAAEDGVEFTTSDWREIVNHPDVDTVLVATPDALHHAEVMATAAAGKHVICEKPVGLNAQEAWEIWQAYQGSGLGHFVPFWTRYVPVFEQARAIVRAGMLGEVKAVIYRWHNPRPPAMPHTWRDDAQLSSAGSIADVGSHAYDSLCWMLDTKATRVLAHARVITPAKPDLGDINLEEALNWGEAHQLSDSSSVREGTAFDYASIGFELANGAVGTLVLSHAPFLRKGLSPEVELHGTDASLAINRMNSTVSVTVAASGDPDTHEVTDSGWGNRFSKFVFPALRESQSGNSNSHPNLEDGYAVQLFTDAAAQSAREGGWVSLEELDRQIRSVASESGPASE